MVCIHQLLLRFYTQSESDVVDHIMGIIPPIINVMAGIRKSDEHLLEETVRYRSPSWRS